MQNWLDVSSHHDFSIYNIPFGIFYTQKNKSTARVGAALGDYVIDINQLYSFGYLNEINGLNSNHFLCSELNSLFLLGNDTCNKIRKKIQSLFLVDNKILKDKSEDLNKILIPSKETDMLLPIKVSDYVDFYSSLDHASNVGKMFRDEKNPLLPNWKHIPIGYHGRSSSIVVSGTNFLRPHGQICPPNSEIPTFGPSKQIDFELEMAFVTSRNTEMGTVIKPDEAENSIFGLALFNDWSARDIQRWEYVPLGPFLGKSFASSLSPWIVSLEALTPFALTAEPKDTPELDYLKCSKKGRFDIILEVYIKSEKMSEPFLIAKSNYKHMYWNLYQQLAHMTSNGSPIRVGDLYASGTISGPEQDSFGSMLEIAWKGTKPIELPDGSQRSFLLDGDTIIIKGYAEDEKSRIGFGSLSGMILPN